MSAPTPPPLWDARAAWRAAVDAASTAAGVLQPVAAEARVIAPQREAAYLIAAKAIDALRVRPAHKDVVGHIRHVAHVRHIH